VRARPSNLLCMCTKRLGAVLLTTLALLAPTGLSGAQADPIEDPTDLLVSDNISIHGTLPEPAAIGARFRDGLMYLTTLGGLSIYDVSNPATPTKLGGLPLPHFENEDVDLGDDILLISNDAAESRGVLYVIDISEPTAPEVIAIHDMGSSPVGPIVDAADFFEQVPYQGNPGHTASCILECAFAWVTEAGGMRLIDLRQPATPVNLGNFGSPAAGSLGITHDVQMDENGIAWISGYGGVAGYQIPADYADAVAAATAPGGLGLDEYHKTLLVAKTDASGHSRYGDTFGLDDGSTYNDFILHNSRRLADSDVVYVTEEDYSRPGCRGAGSFETWNLPMKDEVQEDGTIKRVITGEPMTPIDKWETELLQGTAQPAAMCSAHYFDIKQNVVAQAWYEQGLRLLDVSDPANIRQIGYFIPPNGESWAAYFAPTDPAGRIFYLLDASLGVVVAEYDRPEEGPLSIPPPPTVPKEEEPPTEGPPTQEPPREEPPAEEPAAEEPSAEKPRNEKTRPSQKPPRSGGQGSGSGGSQNSEQATGSGGGSSQTGATVTSGEPTKKPCKAKKTRRARKACRNKRQGATASMAAPASSESYEPTVVAQVRAVWLSGTPGSAPSRQFGYACRISL
jgi:hypothetical protein